MQFCKLPEDGFGIARPKSYIKHDSLSHDSRVASTLDGQIDNQQCVGIDDCLGSKETTDQPNGLVGTQRTLGRVALVMVNPLTPLTPQTLPGPRVTERPTQENVHLSVVDVVSLSNSSIRLDNFLILSSVEVIKQRGRCFVIREVSFLCGKSMHAPSSTRDSKTPDSRVRESGRASWHSK